VKLEVKNLKFGYNSKPILKKINLEASPGKITAIIGPNAVGKSTLLKCIAGILKPEGSILLDGKEINNSKKESYTKIVSYLSQESFSCAVLSVFEVVLLGRIHSLSWRVSNNELKAVWKILKDVGIQKLALRYLNELSGGQRQMVAITQALVREPRVLLLDEPTSNLDLKHQLEILDLIKELTVKRKITTLITLHHLNMAAIYSDELIVINNGEVYASGKPGSILTSEMIRSVYGVNARVDIGNNGIPHIIPISPVRNKYLT